jgi:hypothetical protein
MKPLFAIDPGEQIVGQYLEDQGLRVWMPTYDDGVDLLVTNETMRHPVTVQVKFANRDFAKDDHERYLGWFTLRRKVLDASHADYHVFGFQRGKRETDFVVVPTDELQRRMAALHPHGDRIQVYLLLTEDGRCWEVRDLDEADRERIRQGKFEDPTRDFSQFRNRWEPVVAGVE